MKSVLIELAESDFTTTSQKINVLFKNLGDQASFHSQLSNGSIVLNILNKEDFVKKFTIFTLRLKHALIIYDGSPRETYSDTVLFQSLEYSSYEMSKDITMFLDIIRLIDEKSWLFYKDIQRCMKITRDKVLERRAVIEELSR